MKETTGELNLTLIAVIAIAILVAFFYFAIWPSLDDNFKANSNCSRAVCTNPCKEGENSCPEMQELVKCKIKDSDVEVYCPWKG